MNKKNVLFLLITLFCTITKAKITHIFIDPNVLFTTHKGKASKHVGKWESIRYLNKTGHLPSQQHFFKALQSVPATSKTRTYDESHAAPFIISDWLLGEEVSKLEAAITTFLKKSSLSKTEKAIYTNISNMMFDAEKLAGVQKNRKKIIKLLKELRSQGYIVCFTGNWADIKPLKQLFPQIFTYINDIYISSDLKLLKPETAFWETIWEKHDINPESCLCIEFEPQFYAVASKLPCQTILFNSEKIDQLTKDLRKIGIAISL